MVFCLQSYTFFLTEQIIAAFSLRNPAMRMTKTVNAHYGSQ